VREAIGEKNIGNIGGGPMTWSPGNENAASLTVRPDQISKPIAQHMAFLIKEVGTSEAVGDASALPIV
jgi:hypothetical protein